ncbi:MAG: hypothetical protein P1U56_05590, partial [Saprospiraceae bacterium]|nr:hypothetical protein [Saprospiraceae bacterium]
IVFYFIKKKQKKIDSGIKEVVMREIANIDTQGDIIINSNLRKSPVIEKYKLPDHTMGIWIERFDNFRNRWLK